ncbi:MAG TPA: leucine--tRNA ligase [Fastidiosipila sp.]|nr:leucine--tRNA ligase [Fastidiosipila sp.]
MYSVDIDKKWQEKWAEMKLGEFDPSRIDKKLYILEMFSYPSASKLHVGHWFNYAPPDSWARMQKMRGYEVFQPIGFDAFGLPAENYAIKTGIHPQDSTKANIETMTEQLYKLGGMFDWRANLATCDPDYYRWNQWLFLQLFKNGLAYRKSAPVNWCPDCQTVLANEQVLEDGTCERCSTEVTKKNLTQWFFKITAYADELLDKLSTLDWPEQTKKIQQNWIGRSEGTEVSFEVERDGERVLNDDGTPLTLDVFTTRIDTLFGVTYLVIAPESPLLERLTTEAQKAEVDRYVDKTLKASEIARLATTREKTGVFTGCHVIHPITGEKLELWTADYVIASYGTGVVMAVPAHDTRDFAFAEIFGLPIRRVIDSVDETETELPFVEYGKLVDSGAYTGLTSEAAIAQITADLAKDSKGKAYITYRLRDWLVSRQRYWGTPIPIVYCDQCGTVPLPESMLPLTLPYDVAFSPDGVSPLTKSDAFMQTTCPTCGGPARRDPDTLDTFVCSSWYQFRFVDNHNEEAPFDKEKVNALCPVDMYVGGQEHAAMHLLYSRFITKALRDLGYLDFDEPFQALVHQGMILGSDGQKMSKSAGNTVTPDDLVDQYGGDVFRLHLLFSFAYTEGGNWNDDGVLAITRFISRIEALVDKVIELPVEKRPHDKALAYRVNYTIRGATQDALKFQFNTAIARLMELLNHLQKMITDQSVISEETYEATRTLLLLLAPFAPHFAEEMNEKMGYSPSIFNEPWPTLDVAALVLDEIEIAVQVNGQIKTRLMIPADIEEADLIERIKGHESFDNWIAGKTPVKWIYVKGRLLNIVVK